MAKKSGKLNGFIVADFRRGLGESKMDTSGTKGVLKRLYGTN